MNTSINTIAVLFLFLFFSGGCQKKRIYRDDMIHMMQRADPTFKLFIPDKELPAVPCGDYGPGCVRTLIVRVQGLIMLVIEFETEIEAYREAIHYQGHYKENWLFDNITHEPVLQDFVKKNIGAIAPPKKN